MRLKQLGAQIIVLGIATGVVSKMLARWNPRFTAYGPLSMFVLFAIGALLGGNGMIVFRDSKSQRLKLMPYTPVLTLTFIDTLRYS